MTTGVAPEGATAHPGARGLLLAAHPAPALAVTVMMGLLAVAQGLEASRTLLLVAAVLAGQLSIGWSNDLVDASRDRQAGRRDKPLATGEGSVRLTRLACAGAVVACVALSAPLGTAAGLVHLVCVAWGWAYNLGLKATVWSWVPYAASFGALTAVVTLTDGVAPPWWWPVGAGLLGVGAHLLNVLPDLDDDAATGVRGLPHRLGPARIAPVAAGVLLTASLVVLLGAEPPIVVSAVATLVVVCLAVVVVRGSGRRPFLAAMAIALGDAALLVVAR
ncbi:UbiA family prenyltransferase [Nocardioides sp. SYSU D00065]|uniref:UbiA family prenyltransferase n=1 Tax=Nocardioides sp. SYSU D00065 TaxID=2817378 RepID=UPI001B316967|nr:UbiA family prenyltransferase [Nocardioides sp. SYSU D00065]